MVAGPRNQCNHRVTGFDLNGFGFVWVRYRRAVSHCTLPSTACATRQIRLVLADVLRSELIRRAPKVTRKILDRLWEASPGRRQSSAQRSLVKRSGRPTPPYLRKRL